MSLPPITPHIPQPPDVLLDLPSQLILNRHVGQLGCEIENGFWGKGANSRGGVDVEAGHEARGEEGADAIECFEGALGGFNSRRSGGRDRSELL